MGVFCQWQTVCLEAKHPANMAQRIFTGLSAADNLDQWQTQMTQLRRAEREIQRLERELTQVLSENKNLKNSKFSKLASENAKTKVRSTITDAKIAENDSKQKFASR